MKCSFIVCTVKYNGTLLSKYPVIWQFVERTENAALEILRGGKTRFHCTISFWIKQSVLLVYWIALFFKKNCCRHLNTKTLIFVFCLVCLWLPGAWLYDLRVCVECVECVASTLVSRMFPVTTHDSAFPSGALHRSVATLCRWWAAPGWCCLAAPSVVQIPVPSRCSWYFIKRRQGRDRESSYSEIMLVLLTSLTIWIISSEELWRQGWGNYKSIWFDQSCRSNNKNTEKKWRCKSSKGSSRCVVSFSHISSYPTKKD